MGFMKSNLFLDDRKLFEVIWISRPHFSLIFVKVTFPLYHALGNLVIPFLYKDREKDKYLKQLASLKSQ